MYCIFILKCRQRQSWDTYPKVPLLFEDALCWPGNILVVVTILFHLVVTILLHLVVTILVACCHHPVSPSCFTCRLFVRCSNSV